MLVAEGLGQHIDKGYIYAAMAFAVVVEMINMQLRGPKKKPDAARGPPTAVVPRIAVDAVGFNGSLADHSWARPAFDST